MSGGAFRNVRFPSLCALIRHPRHGYILYDTGYAPHFHSATQTFPELLYRKVTPVHLPPEEHLITQLQSRGIRPADISIIIISHFHADHIAGLRDFPHARFIASAAEYQAIKQRSRIGRLRRAFLGELLPDDFEKRVTFVEQMSPVRLSKALQPFSKGLDLLGDGSITGVDLPGHTESQLGLFIEDGNRERFLVADACWGIPALEKNRRPTFLASRVFSNFRLYNETFAALRELHLRSGSPQVIPSHCDVTYQASMKSKQ